MIILPLYKYFLEIDMAQSDNRIIISQERKYALEILEEIELMNSNIIYSLMDPNTKLLPNHRESLYDLEK